MDELISLVNDKAIELKTVAQEKDTEKLNKLLDEISETVKKMKKETKKIKPVEQTQTLERVGIKSRAVSMLKELKNKIIPKKEKKNKYKLKHVSKPKYQLFKQRLKMLENTVSFHTVMQNAQMVPLQVETKVLEGMVGIKNVASSTKQKVQNVGSEISYKASSFVLGNISRLLNKKNSIRQKIVDKKNTIKRVSGEKLNSLKARIKDIYLTVTTQVGARALYAGEAIEDKMLLIKDRVSRKVHSKKNIIARKTGMYIALYKDSLKKKQQQRAERKIEKINEKIEKNKERIESLKNKSEENNRKIDELRNTRKELLNKLLNRESIEYSQEEGSKTR